MIAGTHFSGQYEAASWKNLIRTQVHCVANAVLSRLEYPPWSA